MFFNARMPCICYAHVACILYGIISNSYVFTCILYCVNVIPILHVDSCIMYILFVYYCFYILYAWYLCNMNGLFILYAYHMYISYKSHIDIICICHRYHMYVSCLSCECFTHITCISY